MRALAITGMVTAFLISMIICGSDMRATPPSARMSAGMRSSAMTATAPAASACVGVGRRWRGAAFPRSDSAVGGRVVWSGLRRLRD